MSDSVFSPTDLNILDAANDRTKSEISVSMIGVVDAVNGKLCDVKPLVKDRVLFSDDTEEVFSIPIVPDCLIQQHHTNTWGTRLPVAVGDFCSLITFDRSIVQWYLGQGGEADPEGFRQHDITDSYATFGFNYKDGPEFPNVDHLVMGKIDGAQIHIKDDLVALFEENPEDFVGLAQLILDRLVTLTNRVNDNSNALNTHIHVTTATIGPSAVPGILVPTTTQVLPPLNQPESVAGTNDRN